MKKLLIPFIVIGLVSCLNAGTVDLVISSLNGQPITPVKEITIKPGDWITFDVVYIGDPGWYLFSMISMVSIEPNNPEMGRLYITDPDTGQNVVTWPAGYWYSDLSKVSMRNERINIDVCAVDLYTVPPGIVLDHFLYQCAGIGDVSILIAESDLPIACCSCDTDGGDLYPIWYGPGLVVHQVYEPACWECPGQPKGDANGDGKINVMDLIIFRKAWGTNAATSPHGTAQGQYNCCADFTQDGKVNIYDLVILRKYWGQIDLGTCSNLGCP